MSRLGRLERRRPRTQPSRFTAAWLPGKEVDGRDPRDDTDHTPQHQTERERHRSATYMMSEQSRFFTPYLLPARRLDPPLDGQHAAVDGGDHRGVVGFGLVGVAPGECA